MNGDYCYYIGASGAAEAELSVIRSNSTIAAEYAIKVVSADKGVTIPESVKFAEGQTSSTLTITAPAGSAPGTVLSFEIMFTGENVNPSANNFNWCIYGIQAYNDPGYRLYYPDSKMIQFWGGYTIYNGDTASYMATQAGWIDIYW